MKLIALKWLPWRFLLRSLARSHGFLDPFYVIGALSHFNQPSEVGEPIELLRAGVVMHARGLINAKAIQHNLDWIWPFWVERQFDPSDSAFLPRAFSITHVNLTHRNWTALGIPGFDCYPIVAPHGMVTPHFDGWSIDCWIIGENHSLLPSRLYEVNQTLEVGDTLRITTSSTAGGMTLNCRAEALLEGHEPILRLTATGTSTEKSMLIFALRPFNPEGISFIHSIDVNDGFRSCTVNRTNAVLFGAPPDSVALSRYADGDVFHHLSRESSSIRCSAGMASGAIQYVLEPRQSRTVEWAVPLEEKTTETRQFISFSQRLSSACRLNLPLGRYSFLFERSLATLMMLSPGEVYPGPYTYRRFWYRDAVFLLHALLCHGFVDESREVISRFASRQKLNGYFHSQDGEWDSNGEVLWLLWRHAELTGTPLAPEWVPIVRKGAEWIAGKRVMEPDLPHSGLLPAGFSAEHLGPSDYYYWDDFWSIAGLQGAADLLDSAGEGATAGSLRNTAQDLLAAVDRSIRRAAAGNRHQGMPASPYRRMDAGAIGSIVCGYPLELKSASDPLLQATVLYLVDHCFYQGGFFQEMTHSGINVYLSLHLAQILLRMGDVRYLHILNCAARLASSTGQWPEAIHPHTGGGCMGDGQHGWASAEWVMMIRSLFVQENGSALILGAGILPEWIERFGEISYGPTLTRFGNVTLGFSFHHGSYIAEWDASWRHPPSRLEIRLRGLPAVLAQPDSSKAVLEGAR